MGMTDLYRSIIVTGGGGMVAYALAQRLRELGKAFALLTRSQLDITKPAEIQAVFQRHRPTLLLNCAAHTRVDQCEDEPELADAINGLAVGLLAKEAALHGTRMVHFSTDFVFDGNLRRPYRADDATHPISAYGKSKLLGETRLREVDPPGWLIIRTSWLFGTHGTCFPQTIVKMAREGRPLKVVNDQFGCPTHTPDLAEATLRLIDAQATGIQHVTNTGVTTWFDFAGSVLETFGLAAELSPVTTAQWLEMRPRQARRPAYSVLETSSYTAHTGHTLEHWKPALVDYRTRWLKAG